MNSNQEFVLIGILLLAQWALQDGIVLAHSCACLQIFGLNSRLRLERVLDVLHHLRLALSKGSGQSVGLIDQDSWVGSSSDDIFRLRESESISGGELGLENSFDLFILGRLIDNPLGKESALSMEQSRVVLDLLLEVGRIRVEAGPQEAGVLAELDVVPVEHWVPYLFFLTLEGFDEVAWCRLDNCDIYFLKLLNSRNKIINLFPVDQGVQVCGIITEWNDDVLLTWAQIGGFLADVNELICF
jgi:hypothetical protein